MRLPILDGKVDAWRRFCQELSTTNLQPYIASRRRLYITYERIEIVTSELEAVAVNVVEAIDLESAFARMATSILPFDSWYRAHLIELHGIDLARYEQFAQPAPEGVHELVFEWRLMPKARSGQQRTRSRDPR